MIHVFMMRAPWSLDDTFLMFRISPGQSFIPLSSTYSFQAQTELKAPKGTILSYLAVIPSTPPQPPPRLLTPSVHISVVNIFFFETQGNFEGLCHHRTAIISSELWRLSLCTAERLLSVPSMMQEERLARNI